MVATAHEKPQEYEFPDRNVVVSFVSREAMLIGAPEKTYVVRDGRTVIGTMKVLGTGMVEIMPARWHLSLPPVREKTKLRAVKRLIEWMPIQDLIRHADGSGCPKMAMGWFIGYVAKQRGIRLPIQIEKTYV